MVTPAPPVPFTATSIVVPAGHQMYRVHDQKYAADAFNPGHAPAAPRTRFAFFGDPPVPILYSADTPAAAIAETILHDIPAAGGNLVPSAYRTRQLSVVETTKELRVASFRGLGLRVLKVTAAELTSTDAADYPYTVPWAEAAFEAGFDGVAYMSRMCNTDPAYAFFDRPSTSNAFRAPGPPLRAFALPDDRDWLDAFCTPLHVNVIA